MVCLREGELSLTPGISCPSLASFAQPGASCGHMLTRPLYCAHTLPFSSPSSYGTRQDMTFSSFLSLSLSLSLFLEKGEGREKGREKEKERNINRLSLAQAQPGMELTT